MHVYLDVCVKLQDPAFSLLINYRDTNASLMELVETYYRSARIKCTAETSDSLRTIPMLLF